MNDLTLDNIRTKAFVSEIAFFFYVSCFHLLTQFLIGTWASTPCRVNRPLPCAKSIFFKSSRQTADKSKPAVNLGEVVVEFVLDLLCIYTSFQNEGQTTGVKHCESIF